MSPEFKMSDLKFKRRITRNEIVKQNSNLNLVKRVSTNQHKLDLEVFFLELNLLLFQQPSLLAHKYLH